MSILKKNTVFVKGFPKTWTHKDLYFFFKKIDKIFSVKVSLDENQSSRGFGMVTFEERDATERCINEVRHHQT